MNLIAFIVLAGLSYYFWFVLAQDDSADANTAFVKVFKGIFGVKGYQITAKVLAVFMAFAAGSELYKFILTLIN